MRLRTIPRRSAVTLAAVAMVLGCGTSSEPAMKAAASAPVETAVTQEASDPPVQLWKGGAFPCGETVTEIQVTAITTGPSDDKKFASQTSMKMDLINDKERILAICGAIGEWMSRDEVLCPPEFLDAHQAELRGEGGKVIATAVRATRFIDTTGKEVEAERTMWLTLPQNSICYELAPADPARLDQLLREALR
jgi:hypothetical protein